MGRYRAYLVTQGSLFPFLAAHPPPPPPLVTAADPRCRSSSVSGWISSSPFIFYLVLRSPPPPSLGPNLKVTGPEARILALSCADLHSSCPPSLLQVVQVVNADALVVKLNSGEYKTIHLSSIRPPRNEGEVGADLSVWHAVGWGWVGALRWASHGLAG